MCFATYGGYMTIGGINTAYHKNDIKYLPYAGNKLYQIKLNKIIFDISNPDEFPIEDKYYTVIDSGTTLTYLPKQIKNKFDTYFNNYCKNNSKCLGINITGSCFYINDQKIEDIYKILPTLSFFLDNDVELNWRPYSYLTPDNKKKTKWCIGVFST